MPPLAAELQCTACYRLPTARQCECVGQGVRGKQVGPKHPRWCDAVVGSLHVTAQTLVLVVAGMGPFRCVVDMGFSTGATSTGVTSVLGAFADWF